MRNTVIDKRQNADFIVYWIGEPVYCCSTHAEKLIGLGKFMGTATPVELYDGEEPCNNCVNERAKNEEQTR